MKYIGSHLGEAIAVLVSVIGMIILLNRLQYTAQDGTQTTGYNAALGKAIEVDEQRYNNYQDTSELQSILNVSDPVIEFSDVGLDSIKAGSAVTLTDYFTITYGDGNELRASDVDEFKVVEILNADNNSIINDYNEDQHTMVFTSAGIYTVELYVYDSENRETTVRVKIPVGGDT